MAKISTFSAYPALTKTQNYPTRRIISLEEVSWHDSWNDCWIAIYDRIYDITKFLDEHPGGCDVLMEYAGRDASVAFRASSHSAFAVRSLEKFLIGELPTHERMFTKSSDYFLTDNPE